MSLVSKGWVGIYLRSFCSHFLSFYYYLYSFPFLNESVDSFSLGPSGDNIRILYKVYNLVFSYRKFFFSVYLMFLSLTYSSFFYKHYITFLHKKKKSSLPHFYVKLWEPNLNTNFCGTQFIFYVNFTPYSNSIICNCIIGNLVKIKNS